jgi:hypothetical protein
MEYKRLLVQAFDNISQANFDAIRQAYSESAEYAPYATPPDMTPLKAAMDAEKWAEAGVMCAEMLQADYLQINLHLLMAHLYDQVDEKTRANWHLAFANGLTRSIMDSGDGRSFETAIKVIAIREEYDVIRLLGLRPLRQELVSHEGHRYDVIDVADQEGNPQGQLFFDVEALQTHLERETGTIT